MTESPADRVERAGRVAEEALRQLRIAKEATGKLVADAALARVVLLDDPAQAATLAEYVLRAADPSAPVCEQAAETRFVLERDDPEPPQETWWAFECFACYRELGDSGCVFDVRLPSRIDLRTARCPRCGAECDRPRTWGATANGYGSRGDCGMHERVLELEAELAALRRGDKSC